MTDAPTTTCESTHDAPPDGVTGVTGDTVDPIRGAVA